ncbi:hypothetical protein [Curtobacterium sp. Leaf261]|uniref:hypothetical protein n=1 Tax=Curtobacterium sp. Leaf261 TaxID=1736311 RepID=UPI0006FE801D|nr:hypothetical protein [Curtobacterium sp. Leaf261]KQO62882.1 hypothetical protein ASF23_08140 [Curtobacterium sp. Leaf261]
MLNPTRPRSVLLTAAAAAVLTIGLTGCSSDTVKQATDLGSSVAGDVSSSVEGITGGAIQDGMSSIAGGIDGALDSALEGADITSDGTTPEGFPTAAVPLVDGTVLGGGAGPNGSGWVVQVRVGAVSDFAAAQQQLEDAGFTDNTVRTETKSAFGLFRSSDHRVVLTFAENKDGVTATYIVTPR